MTTKTYLDLDNFKEKKIVSQLAPYTGLSRTSPGANWDTQKISAISDQNKVYCIL